MTQICIPIFIKAGVDWGAQIRAAQEALRDEAGLIELRCDEATPDEMLASIRSTSLPAIVTIRPTWEGGFCQRSLEQRAVMFTQAAEAGAAYMDIELVSWRQSEAIRRVIEGRRAAGLAGPQLILSSHDFSGRPDLGARLDELAAIEPAVILKIAFKASTVADAVDALALVETARRKYGKPLVALAMGEKGQLSRHLSGKFGQPFTFAALAHGNESAPGQATVHEMKELYRWAEQASDWPVFGVIGWPVGHSLSPHIHNAGFKHAGLRGVYVPVPIEPRYDEFAAVVDALRDCSGMNLRGLSVTIPHKENAMRYVTERGGGVDELSRHIGVINTMVWQAEGTLRGLNSDYAGALDALVAAWNGRREDLAGKRVAVLGAGGAARAIVAGLAAYGAHVTIYNRTLSKAEALAADFNGRTGKVDAAPWDEIRTSECAIYINCTPLGMHPKIDGCPIDFDPYWDKKTIVFDTVYNPLKTRLLELAEKKGARTVTGMEMFIGQAAIQFEAFTGKPAPTEIFRRIMLEKLTAVRG